MQIEHQRWNRTWNQNSTRGVEGRNRMCRQIQSNPYGVLFIRITSHVFFTFFLFLRELNWSQEKWNF